MAGNDPTPDGRDRKATEGRLIQAVLDIIREQGYADLGVNAIAARAGASKVLIYRYFGDLRGLLRAAADRMDPLQADAADALMAQVDPGVSAGELIRQTVTRLHTELKDDELTKQLLVWELSRSNEMTEVLAAAREEVGLRLTDEFEHLLSERGVPASLDVNALLAIVTAAVSYLTLRSESVRDYNGIDLRSAQGWERLGSTLELLLDSLSGTTDRLT